MKKVAFVSDFDGTITKEDFFNMVVNQLLTPEDLNPWNDYVAGKITHVEALSRIFSKVRIPKEEMDVFISNIQIDEKFPDVLALCKELGIPVSICSAGMDYYIYKRIPGLIKEYGIKIISNKGEYYPDKGFVLTPPPPEYPYYDKNIGISKEALVEEFKNDGYFTIYAGDGRPDIKAAKAADAVFARDVLLELCIKENVKTEKFDDFGNIADYIGGMYGAQ